MEALERRISNVGGNGNGTAESEDTVANANNNANEVSKFKENDEERFSQLCELETKLIGEVITAMKNNDATTFGLKMSENQKYLEEIQVTLSPWRELLSY